MKINEFYLLYFGGAPSTQARAYVAYSKDEYIFFSWSLDFFYQRYDIEINLEKGQK